MLAWLGLGRGEKLEGHVVAVSPHLDDAVLSLGAALARAARGGSAVTVLTVLAGNPDSQAAAGEWDREAGFRTAGEAARARREEDRRACALLGAVPVWLPFSDHQYDRGADDETIRAAVLEACGAAGTVLVPGFPLLHEDHAWLNGLLLRGGLGGGRIGVYVEQPYAALWTSGPEDAPRWLAARAGVRDRMAKLRASKAYSSQLPLLDGRPLSRIAGYEARRGGEQLAWVDQGAR